MIYDYDKFCAHRWDMSTPVGLPDLGVVGGNPGVGTSIVSNPPGIGGICAEFNGNNSNYNLGDIVELNAVSAFTIAFWMNQNVIDQNGFIFNKVLNGTNDIALGPQATRFYFELGADANTYGQFDYSTVMNAGQWHHIAAVFDGSQAGNATRMVIYVDAQPVTLTFGGSIPAITADLAGVDAYIGRTALTLDGELDDFRLYSVALTNLDVSDLMARSRRGATGG